MKEPLPGGLSTAPASLLLIASGTVVALPWPFLNCIARAFNCPVSLELSLHYSHRSVCFWCTALKAVLHCSTRSALPQVALSTRTSASFFWKFRTFTADFSVGTLVVVVRFLSSYVGRLTSGQVFQSLYYLKVKRSFTQRKWGRLRCPVPSSPSQRQSQRTRIDRRWLAEV